MEKRWLQAVGGPAGEWVVAAALLLGSGLMVLLVMPYFLTFDLAHDFLRTKQNVVYHRHYQVAFYAHIGSGCVCLLAGLLQFNRWLLRQRPRLHRRLGWAYVVAVLGLSAPGGLIMGWYGNGGLPAQVSFVLQGLLWIHSTSLALRYAIRGDFRTHSHWMLRSYALALAALTLRFYAWLIPQFVLLPGRDWYITLVWISWVPNLLLAEWCIQRKWVPRWG
jgi:hypothetical protein